MAFLSAALPDAAAGASAPGESTPGPQPSSTATAAIIVSSLVHEVQRERGISALYAASGGSRFGKELRRQRLPTDRRYQQLAELRRRQAGALPAGVVERLGRAERLLHALTTSRRRVEDLEVPAADLIELYSRANGELLGALEELLSAFVGETQRSAAIAWMALSHAKERTGLERAQLASAFERDRYLQGQYEAVVGLVSSRQAYLHLFSTAAPSEGRVSIAARRSSGATTAIAQMEKLALDRPRGGFGVDPTVWFATITREIDLFSEMELAVRRSLTAAPAA
jgi:methyl-accepting chemotaxis protein